MPISLRFCWLLSFALLAGCNRVMRNGPIITKYESSKCIPSQIGPGTTPPTRTWDFSLTTSAGEAVRVLGAQTPGGQIVVRYVSDGADVVAANAGDYIYPADVRVDNARQKLYVKASGITAAFSQPQTWLFEYDLAQRRQIDHARVDSTVLRKECQAE
jgi:hypothetical protein